MRNLFYSKQYDIMDVMVLVFADKLEFVKRNDSRSRESILY